MSRWACIQSRRVQWLRPSSWAVRLTSPPWRSGSADGRLLEGRVILPTHAFGGAAGWGGRWCGFTHGAVADHATQLFPPFRYRLKASAVSSRPSLESNRGEASWRGGFFDLRDPVSFRSFRRAIEPATNRKLVRPGRIRGPRCFDRGHLRKISDTDERHGTRVTGADAL